MIWRIRKPVKVFAHGTSLRGRVAYSLAAVRLVLVPVIFLAIYYLFKMGWIVDRIVSVDANVATLAERASIEMLDARRTERNYFLVHDPHELQANRHAIARLQEVLAQCREIQPEERANLDYMQGQAKMYQLRLEEAVTRLGQRSQVPTERVQEVVRAYEKDLNNLIRHTQRESRGRLIQELQNRLGSLDSQVSDTLIAEDSAFRQITADLRNSSGEVLRLAGELEKRSWERVQRDHQQARSLVRRAEWVLGIISGLTLLLSVWVSFVLPPEVIRPLAELKAAVDHAAAGNYGIEFDVQGDSEVAQLANSVRRLIEHVNEKRANANATPHTDS